jgi:hypothetical protein
MYEAVRVAYQRLNRNGRGAKFLDYTLMAGNFVVTSCVLLASAGVKLPIH